MKILKLSLTILIFFILTVLTQVGGIVFLISIYTNHWLNKWVTHKLLKTTYQFIYFSILYGITTFLIVPIIAKPFGRVPLPIKETNHLRPLNILTCFLNRNYVRSELHEAAIDIANKMNSNFEGTTVNYLDANFPFINKFPLLPHLSHNDGKKLDLSFCYIDNKTNSPTNKAPSFIGYGICEEPLPHEKNTAEFCSENGYWQYSFLTKVVSQQNKTYINFDSIRTRALMNIITENNHIEKVFIEPHLKTRLNLTSNKIRFHGCQAVRHDDHIHLQVK